MADSDLALKPEAVERIAKKLFGNQNKKLSKGRTLRFGRQGSLAVVPGRGVFRDHESGKGGGLLDLVVLAGRARSRGEAYRLLENEGELAFVEDPAEREARRRREEAERAERMRVARDLWSAGVCVAGTPAETYLRGRRCVRAPLMGIGLRFLPDAPINPYKPDKTCPALIAKATDHRGALTGAHLTYLRPDGSDKAALPVQRKMVGIISGAHVRLLPGQDLLVGEGIETSFSAWDELEAEDCDVGCVAALSADGVANFVWPPSTTGLIIAFDRDKKETGEKKARMLARRAHGAGLRVSLMGPPEGHDDWNALAQARGRP